MILKYLHLPIWEKSKKPSSMSDEDWDRLDQKAIATIRQYLGDTIYFHFSQEKTTKSLSKSFVIYMNKIQQSINYF